MSSPSYSAIKRCAKANTPGNHSPALRILGEPSPGLFPSRGDILKLLVVVFIAGSVALAFNLVSGILNRRTKSFCDSGDSSPDLGICEPCPEKGWCSNGNLKCMLGYEKQGRRCVENGQFYRSAKKLTKVVEDDVCRSYAHVLCARAGKIWFEEGDVIKILDEHKAKEDVRVEGDTFRLLIHKVLETVEGSLETKANSHGSKKYKCPELLAELHRPLDCWIRQWLYRHSLLVTCGFITVVWLMRFSWILHRKQILFLRAEKLYEEVCEILEDKAMKTKTKNEGEPWLVASWLRDHLLQPRERKDSTLWTKVEELIQEDSRIYRYPKLVKGESKTVLEWQAHDALSSRKKTKKNVKRIDSEEPRRKAL